MGNNLPPKRYPGVPDDWFVAELEKQGVPHDEAVVLVACAREHGRQMGFFEQEVA